MNSPARPSSPACSPSCPDAQAGASASDAQAGRGRSPLRDAAWWAAHFRANRLRDWRIPWHAGAVPLPAREFARIAGSVAEFQRGESSEARNYLEKSAVFALRSGDPHFHEASVLFVREENEHAALLLRFMNGAGIPPRQRIFADGVFRRLRAVGDLGWSSRVLLVAEFVAQEYYPCLRATTTHPVLRRVCDKLIHDEFAHIRFQIERIARVEHALPPASRRLRDWLQGLVLAGAALEVYRGHRGVLSRLGLPGFLFGLFRRLRCATRAARSPEAFLVSAKPLQMTSPTGLRHL